MYYVVYEEVDTNKLYTRIVSGKVLAAFEHDWAFIVLHAEKI